MKGDGKFLLEKYLIFTKIISSKEKNKLLKQTIFFYPKQADKVKFKLVLDHVMDHCNKGSNKSMNYIISDLKYTLQILNLTLEQL